MIASRAEYAERDARGESGNRSNGDKARRGAGAAYGPDDRITMGQII